MISRSWPCLALLLCATLASVASPEPPLPLGDARGHGVKPKQRKALDRIIDDAVSAGNVPGVGLLVAHRGEILVRATYGSLGRWFGVETPTRISDSKGDWLSEDFMLTCRPSRQDAPRPPV